MRASQGLLALALALALALVGACTSKGTQTQLEPASEPASEPDPVIVEPSPNENRRELSPLLGGSVVVHSPTPGRWASRVDFDQHYYVTMEHVIRNSMRGSAVLRLDDDGHARACFETVKYDSSDMSHYQANDHKDHHYANEFAMVVGMSGTWSRPSADAPEIEVCFDRMNWRTCEVDPTREPFEQPAWRCVAVAANADYANPNSRIFPVSAQFQGTWDVTVQAAWSPTAAIVAGATASRLSAQRTQIEAQAAQLREGIELEVRNNWAGVRAAEAQIEAARASLASVEEDLRVRRKRVGAGSAIATDVADAEANVLRARLGVVNAGVDLRVARARLRRAIGPREGAE